MNMQQLSVFREVMEAGSVSAAARNLNRTQPAVSASLKALEESLGMELFQREGRRLIPVPEAQYLLAEATEILDRLALTRTNLVGMRDRAKGLLRIVAMPGPSAHLLPEFVSNFKGDAHDLRISLSTRSSPQVLNLIAAQSYDIGFCDLGVAAQSKDARRRELYNIQTVSCDCICALPAGHRLAGRDVINARMLDGEPMGALQSSHATCRDTRAAFEREGAEFNLCVEAQYFLPLLHFVEASQICAVVDPLSAESYLQTNRVPDRIRFVRFEPVVPFGYSLVTPRQRPLSHLAQGFIAGWRQYVETAVARRASNAS